MSYAAVATGERIDVRSIPLGLIDNGPAVRRELLDDAHAEALWENIDQLPNIAVRVTGDRYQLIDGRHRLAAHKFAKRDTITAEVYDVDDRQLWIMAVEANTSHGRPLDLGERKAVAAQLLKVAPDLSNRAIAKHCGLSDKTIGKMRPESGAENPHLSERRTGADGKSYPVSPKPEPVTGEATDREAVGVESDDVPSSPAFDPGEAALGDDAESLCPPSPGSPLEPTAEAIHDEAVARLKRSIAKAHDLLTWKPEDIHALNDPECAAGITELMRQMAPWWDTYKTTKPTGLVVHQGGKA